MIYTDQRVSDTSLRSRVRHRMLDAMGFAQRANGDRTNLKRGRVHILCMHTMFADEVEPFRRMISALAKHFTFVSFGDAVHRISVGDLDTPYMAFSFDDGIRNNIRAAAVLEEFGVRGIFYVCPSIVGESDERKIEVFCRERLKGPTVEFLNWNDLEDLLRRGHEIGSHTFSHQRLSELEEDAVMDELLKARTILADRLDQGHHLAWPYGTIRDIPANLGKLANDAGYVTCASGIRGCHVMRSETSPDIFCVRRENVQATWPVEHVLTFLCQSSAVANARSNLWPASL